MYAIIRAGGKQAKVREGDVIDVERIKGADGTVTFTPLLLVDEDGSVVAEPDALEKATVTAEVVGEHRGPKVDVFTYKNKSGSRRRQGHRQTYTTIKVTSIAATKKKAAKKSAAEKSAAEKSGAAAKKSAAKKSGAAAKDEVAETAAADEAVADTGEEA
jgi:large subunit ribosomal protein L21